MWWLKSFIIRGKDDVRALQGRCADAQGDVGQAGGLEECQRWRIKPSHGLSRHLRPVDPHQAQGHCFLLELIFNLSYYLFKIFN